MGPICTNMIMLHNSFDWKTHTVVKCSSSMKNQNTNFFASPSNGPSQLLKPSYVSTQKGGGAFISLYYDDE